MADELVEVRENGDGGGLGDVWIADQPAGQLLVNLQSRLRDLQERVEDLEAENELLQSQLAEQQSQVQDALAYAGAVDDGARADGSPSKAHLAKLTSRNLAVTRAARAPKGGAVTVADVQDREMRADLRWKTIAEDAWGALVEEWDCFEIQDATDEHPKRLVLHGEEAPRALVRAVEQDVGREDLVNSVVGRDA